VTKEYFAQSHSLARFMNVKIQYTSWIPLILAPLFIQQEETFRTDLEHSEYCTSPTIFRNMLDTLGRSGVSILICLHTCLQISQP